MYPSVCVYPSALLYWSAAILSPTTMPPCPRHLLVAAIIAAFTARPLFAALAMPKKIENVVFSIAMEDEARPFVQSLGLAPQAGFFPKAAPFVAYRGKYKGCTVTVVTSGKDSVYGEKDGTGVDNVGTVPAALAAFLAMEKLGGEGGADLLVNAGTCGGFGKMGAGIGDVYLTTASANHDRRIPLGPAFEAYGTGSVPTTPVPGLLEALSPAAKPGVCTTGNSLDATPTDLEQMAANGAHVKDMEAASVGWACELHGVPHFGVKVVTDIVDGDRPTQEEFLENLGTAASTLQDALPKVIDHVCGKGHDEL